MSTLSNASPARVTVHLITRRFNLVWNGSDSEAACELLSPEKDACTFRRIAYNPGVGLTTVQQKERLSDERNQSDGHYYSNGPRISGRAHFRSRCAAGQSPDHTQRPAQSHGNIGRTSRGGYLIKVEVDHLAEWAGSNPVNNPAKLVPYLNGLALRGNYPEEIHIAQNHLRFHLRITPENKNVWVDLLGAPHGLRHAVSFSVGLENQSQFDTVFDQNNPASLTVISPWYGVIALVIVLVTLVLLVWLARTTNLIREPGPKPIGGKRRPYNLGRTQMALWFFLVYASYVVIWLITDALDTITPSLLGLMGISAGTALGEALIDSGKDAATASSLQDLTAEKETLEQSIPELQAQVAGIQAKETMTPDDL